MICRFPKEKEEVIDPHSYIKPCDICGKDKQWFGSEDDGIKRMCIECAIKEGRND